jgi:hypothetical protein
MFLGSIQRELSTRQMLNPVMVETNQLTTIILQLYMDHSYVNSKLFNQISGVL